VDSRPQVLRPAETTCSGPSAGKPSTRRCGKRGDEGAATEPVERLFLSHHATAGVTGGGGDRMADGPRCLIPVADF
jgi:hypothetical protein